jgi:6-phosphogluconolactonase
MSTEMLPGEVFTAKDATDVAREAARRLGAALRGAISARGRASLALSGGNTPRPAYELLAVEPGVDWGKVFVFWIDERAVPATHARSNYRLAKESLLERVAIPPDHVSRMAGDAPNLAEAAADYARTLREKLEVADGVPILDAAVLGVGDDGHTASLFPGEASVLVRDRIVLDVAAAPEQQREARLSVTAPVIERIRTAVVLATGAAKHGPLERVAAAEGDLRQTPSRVMRGVRGSLTWILDPAAAGR